MARLARVILPGVPHHITQRGNAQRYLLNSDADRLVYLRLLGDYARTYQLSLLGYCLMTNHVHLIAIPSRADSLPHAMRQIHGRYAAYLNAREGSSGHIWQARYYSCPLDTAHFYVALRYIERNPVRAGMVAEASRYRWSSAAFHCGLPSASPPVEPGPWAEEWTAPAWREFLGEESAAEADAIRGNTHTGRPLGTRDFVAAAERTLHRSLTPGKGGRPSRRMIDERQCALYFLGGQ